MQYLAHYPQGLAMHGTQQRNMIVKLHTSSLASATSSMVPQSNPLRCRKGGRKSDLGKEFEQLGREALDHW